MAKSNPEPESTPATTGNDKPRKEISPVLISAFRVEDLPEDLRSIGTTVSGTSVLKAGFSEAVSVEIGNLVEGYLRERADSYQDVATALARIGA